MSIKLGDNIEITGPQPNDARYLNVNVPWASTGETNAALLGGVGGVRYTGLTVNIAGTEYWYKNGIEDADLIPKETGGGGGTLNMSGSTVGGLTTLVDANTICAHNDLTYDGTILSVAANIEFDGSANRWICMPTVTDGTVGASSLVIEGSSRTAATSAVNTGSIYVCAGNGNVVGDSIRGGSIYLLSGKGTSAIDAIGGHMSICGGSSSTTGGGTSVAGNVVITAGLACGSGTNTCGCVELRHGGAPAGITVFETKGDGVDITGKLCTDTIQISTGAAAGCILCSDASGNGTWVTPPSAGGTDLSIGSNTGTVVRIDSSTGTNATLPLASATVAGVVSNTTQTFAGTKTTTVWCASTSVDTPLVNVTTGDIVFCNTGTRNIYVETSSSGVGQNITMIGGCAAAGSNYGGSAVICGAVGGCSSSSPGTGGNAATLAGQGGENTAIGQGGAGGRAIVRAGCGGYTLGGQGGDGGQAELCGGQGYPAGSGCGAGGDVKIQSGCGTNAGCVMIYHGGTLRMNSTTTGMYTNGVHCASTCVCSPVFCATTAFRATGAGARFCGGSGCGYALDWISSSDCRIKKCIEPITSALSTVDALCGVYYELCEDNTPDMGLIAQDVFKVEPRLVSHDEPIEEYKKYGVDDELLGLKYDKFAGLFVEAIKELKAQNICLQNQINELNKIK